ncbi:hypothetical protein [Streptomyces sp. XD-27]|uniref:hypothetical protein n=1 Tax=Streptomyces sp. XD-27 TaxID=3062779 RepID=UPI0026F465D5|nr:hypothetical protein [Streptomyces sp. XD-27]WKX74059.1 hypothetical protein Q3Y56_33100 [Streptomyces sp. XD-27]
MLVNIEAVQQDPSGPTTVRVHSAVGTAVVLWQGAPEAAGHEHHVEWTVDEDIVWAENMGLATSAVPELREDGDRIVFRGRLSLTEDGAALVDVGGTLILFELAGPAPPDGADKSWVEVRVGRNSVSLWPYRL